LSERGYIFAEIFCRSRNRWLLQVKNATRAVS